MKASHLIATLNKAVALHGDVDAMLLDAETGDWKAVESVVALHPYTGPLGRMDRAQPVNALGILTCQGRSPDVIVPDELRP